MKSPRLRTREDDYISVSGVFSEGEIYSDGEQIIGMSNGGG